MVDVVFRTRLALFGRVIKIIWEVACNTCFWGLEWKRLRAFTSFLLWIKFFIQRTLVTCFSFFIEKERDWTSYAFGVSLEWSVRITKTFFACDIVGRVRFASFTVKRFVVPLRIDRARCAVLAIEKRVFLWANTTLLCIYTIDLSFRTLFTSQATEVKILWMNAQNTCFIV